METDMGKQDIRWIQRFANYSKALAQLESAVALSKERGLSELERQGLIQAFEYSYELAWKVIKDYYEHQGETGIQGSRDAIRLAFRRELILDGDAWMMMVESRIESVHTYNEETADKIVGLILDRYHDELVGLRDKLIPEAGRE